MVFYGGLGVGMWGDKKKKKLYVFHIPHIISTKLFFCLFFFSEACTEAPHHASAIVFSIPRVFLLRPLPS